MHKTRCFVALLLGLLTLPVAALAQDQRAATQQLARDIFEQLIEINTTDSQGNTTEAAEAMAARLQAAGFPAEDLQVLGPHPRKDNLVARLRGDGSRAPLLLLAHLDVVEARREDWSVDPFTFLEQDGKRLLHAVQLSEKMYLSFRLEVKNPGGHSSIPVKDNAIYHLAQGLTRLAKFDFPIQLNDGTRVFFERMSEIETGEAAADMKALLETPPDNVFIPPGEGPIVGALGATSESKARTAFPLIEKEVPCETKRLHRCLGGHGHPALAGDGPAERNPAGRRPAIL